MTTYTVAAADLTPIATILSAPSRTHAFHLYLKLGGAMRKAGLWLIEGTDAANLMHYQAEFFTPADYRYWRKLQAL